MPLVGPKEKHLVGQNLCRWTNVLFSLCLLGAVMIRAQLTGTERPRTRKKTLLLIMLIEKDISTHQLRSIIMMFGRGGAVVRARACDIVVGGCEFKSRHCHLTGHIPEQIMLGPLILP